MRQLPRDHVFVRTTNRMWWRLDGICAARAPEMASVSRRLLLGLQLLHGLGHHGAVRAGQPSRDSPSGEQISVADRNQLAAANPDLTRTQQVVGSQDGHIVSEQVLHGLKDLAE